MDMNNNTLLHFELSKEKIEFLVCERKLDVNAKNKDGNTPLLIYSAKDNINLEIIKTFLELKSDPFVKNKKGKTIVDFLEGITEVIIIFS